MSKRPRSARTGVKRSTRETRRRAFGPIPQHILNQFAAWEAGYAPRSVTMPAPLLFTREDNTFAYAMRTPSA